MKFSIFRGIFKILGVRKDRGGSTPWADESITFDYQKS
jgi:hypothetical protein